MRAARTRFKAALTGGLVLVDEVERAIARSPKKLESGRYAVYVPGAVVIGTYGEEGKALCVASTWTRDVPEVVVVDRQRKR